MFSHIQHSLSTTICSKHWKRNFLRREIWNRHDKTNGIIEYQPSIQFYIMADVIILLSSSWRSQPNHWEMDKHLVIVLVGSFFSPWSHLWSKKSVSFDFFFLLYLFPFIFFVVVDMALEISLLEAKCCSSAHTFPRMACPSSQFVPIYFAFLL